MVLFFTKTKVALMLLLIWADEEYNTQKNPCVVFATQKNPGVFHRPKKIPFGQNVRPKKILRIPPSLKYVSGAPGAPVLQVLTVFRTKRWKNHTLWDGTHLVGLYKGEYSLGENPWILKILSMGLGARL